MSRFVRQSKYRHVWGQSSRREHGIENLKVTNSAWDTNIVSASAKYISINWNASGGGAFAVLPLPSPYAPVTTASGGSFPYKLPDTLPLARSHTAAVLDTDWSPHSDSIVASGGEDGKVMIWKIDDCFEGWGEDGWEPPRDFDPVTRIDASPKKIGQIVWHPTAAHVLASASGEHTIKLWDLSSGDGEVRAVLGSHGDAIQGIAFNAVGTVLATTCRDRKLRLFDVRAGGEPVRVSDGHGGMKGARVVWMGEMDRIATTGFSKMSDRQVGIWETGGLGNVRSLMLDQSSGVVMPFWSDNNILFLAGKGDGNIRYYEYESDNLFDLSEHKSTDPQRGMCFLPRRALNVWECEIARAYKVHGSMIEPIAFIVPRKADSFQSDIYPPAPSIEPSLTAAEFFAGKTAARKLVKLDSGTVFQPATPALPTVFSASPAASPIPQSTTLSPPRGGPVRSHTAPEQAPEQFAATPSSVARSQSGGPASGGRAVGAVVEEVEEAEKKRGAEEDGEMNARELEEENARLTSELREARKKIRNLELQVEGLRANARKVAQALLYMTLLHACILRRDLKSFQRLLNVLGTLADVNEKDSQGRTALHLACAISDGIEYVRLLLKHPSANVNVPDNESHYTPLHRAMYVANLPAALSIPPSATAIHLSFGLSLLLLQRPDIDLTLKDYEGYTAFDLYNSTIDGTKPDTNDLDAELFMWGANVNATLGFSDGNNRSHPDQIVIQPKEDIPFPQPGPTLQDRFSPIRVRQVGMSKLHTVIVTSESGSSSRGRGGGNLRVCGFGSSGRLGPSPYHHIQQYALSPLPHHAFSPNVQITQVAAGQDHTLALTRSGEVFSWGMNRFAQLGYVVRNQSDSAGSGAVGAGAGTVGGGWSGDGRTGEWGRWESKIEGGGKGAGSLDDTIQHTPRRVQDALRREVVVGIAASKMASACWTANGDLFTWGTNSGQLGHERSSHPQVLPRKVSKITHKVIDVALSDTAMACLLHTRDVICVCNDKDFKINFPVQTLPPKIQPYRPPPRKREAGISKLTTCDDVFAALSLYGEVFVFTTQDGGGDVTSGGRTTLIKPQRAWVLKKKYRAVKDVALGANGDIIVCTESGHVFVRTRSPVKVSDKSGGGGGVISGSLTGGSSMTSATQSSKIGSNFNFVRVPCLQRVTRVCANNAGAFGALKVDYRHAPIEIVGNGIAEDLKEVMPFVVMYGGEQWERTKKGGRYGLGLNHCEEQERTAPSQRFVPQPIIVDPDDANTEDVNEDVLQLRRLCELVEQEKKGRKDYPKDRRLPFDADVIVFSQSEAAFPAHRAILAARSSVLCSVLEGGKVPVKDDKTNVSVRFVASKGKQTSPLRRPFPSILTSGKLIISGSHALTILIFLTYLYCDELFAIWDPRVKMELQKECVQLKVKPSQVKAELQVLARLLDLPLLSEALEPWVKRVPVPSIARDMGKLWLTAQEDESVSKINNALAPDVLLQLADRNVWCHSVMLRTRSDLFASFFGEEEWTVDRWSGEGILTLNMRHLRWHVMQYVLRFIFCGEELELFERLDFADSLDDVLEFMFSVMGAATELLLNRLVLICSSVILEHVNIQNACYILNDATHYNAKELIERLQMYMIANLETLLDQRMLDDFPHRLVKQLSAFARRKQAEKSPISRTTVLVDAMIEKHAEWLALQDIPEPIVRLNRPHGGGINIASKRSRLSLTSATAESMERQRTIRRPPSGEDIFIMDPEGPTTDVGKTYVWKPHSVPRVDMKSLMAAEAAANYVSVSPPSAGVTKKSMPIRQAASKDDIATTPPPASSLQRTSSTSWRIPVNPPTTPKKPTPPGTPPATGLIPQSSRKCENASETSLRESGVSRTKPPPPTTLTRSSSSRRTQATPDSRSNLGPIITPTRQPSKTESDVPSIRRVSGKAWVLPPVEPVIATSPTPATTTSAMSFVAIQQLQLEQATAPAKDRRSLRDIQAEEEARQQEEGFLRWWMAEEERVRIESEAAMSRAVAESRVGVRGINSKRKGTKGGGKGHNGLVNSAHSRGGEQSQGMVGGGGEQQHGTPERKGKQPRKPTRPKKHVEDTNTS